MFVHPSTYFFHKHLASAHYVLGTTARSQSFVKEVLSLFLGKKMEVLKTTLVLALVLSRLHPLTHRHMMYIHDVFWGPHITYFSFKGWNWKVISLLVMVKFHSPVC